MNKRNPWTMTNMTELKTKLEGFYDEGGGMSRAFLVRREDDDLRKNFEAEHPLAVALVSAVIDGLKAIDLRGASIYCLGCHRAKFRNEIPEAFMVWLPGGKTEAPMQHENMMAMPICPSCAKRSDERLFESGLDVMSNVFPDMEVIEE